MTRFNPYMSHIDISFFRQLCIQCGTLHHLKRGTYLLQEGEIWPYWGFVQQGILKYSCLNLSEQKYYNVGFSFEDEFFADYPVCLYERPATLNIQTITSCDIYICSAELLRQKLEEDTETQQTARVVAEQLFMQSYARYLDLYRFTPEERYLQLLKRCPEILQLLPLKEIASYLMITPTHMSRIRKNIVMNNGLPYLAD